MPSRRYGRRVPELTVITQNVDDLHEWAGSREGLHLHGRLLEPYCQDCGRRYVYPPGIPDVPLSGAPIDSPWCEACGGRVRPGVVWFGEGLPQREWHAALDAARRCDVFFCIGTSSVVQAASLTAMAAEAGAMTVQVNPNATEVDGLVAWRLTGPAGVILPRLLAEWSEGLGA